VNSFAVKILRKRGLNFERRGLWSDNETCHGMSGGVEEKGNKRRWGRKEVNGEKWWMDENESRLGIWKMGEKIKDG
jgi:hypothetical protein